MGRVTVEARGKVKAWISELTLNLSLNLSTFGAS